MARPNHSVEKLSAALIRLMHEMPFAEITVTDISREAGLSRISFYRNFNTKEDLLLFYMEQVVEAFEEDIYAEGACSLQRYFTMLFTTIGSYSDTIRETSNAGLNEILLKVFNRYLFRTPMQELGFTFNIYNVRFYTGAFYNVLLEWILSGKKESPEEMAQLCCRMIQ